MKSLGNARLMSRFCIVSIPTSVSVYKINIISRPNMKMHSSAEGIKKVFDCLTYTTRLA